MLKGWVRVDERTIKNEISGKLSKRERELFERYDRKKGEYRYRYSHSTGKTTIVVREHPEWRV